MPIVARFAAALVVAVLTVVPLAAQQPPLTAGEIAQIKKDVTEAVEKYYRLFSERNMKALPEEVYNIPWILMSATGPQPNLTKEQALAGFEASLKQLVENGWGKSVYTTTNVCVLNRAAAITSGYNTRYRQDGSVMQVAGVAYVFSKTNDGWRIVTYSGTQKDTVVKCD
jgi:glucose-6-phosphate isomerase